MEDCPIETFSYVTNNAISRVMWKVEFDITQLMNTEDYLQRVWKYHPSDNECISYMIDVENSFRYIFFPILPGRGLCVRMSDSKNSPGRVY